MKMLCVGDSLVDGYPFGRADSFPAVIEKITDTEVINAGISGQSSAEILRRFPEELRRAGDDLGTVLILCGSNDYIFSICEPEKTMEHIRGMISASENECERILLCAPPLCIPEQASRQWADMPPSEYDAVNEKLKMLRDMLESEAAGRSSADFFDLQEMYKGFASYVDGVHPVREGYRIIGERIAEEFC